MRRLALLLLLLPAPLVGQDSVPPPDYTGSATFCLANTIHQRFSMPWPGPYDGRWWNEYDALLAHERTHVQQMSRYSSCAAFRLALATHTDSLLVEFETEAGCAQSKLYVQRALGPARVYGGVIIGLVKRKVSDTVSIPTLANAVRRYCPEMLGESP